MVQGAPHWHAGHREPCTCCAPDPTPEPESTSWLDDLKAWFRGDTEPEAGAS